jgi:hypothetical protein
MLNPCETNNDKNIGFNILNPYYVMKITIGSAGNRLLLWSRNMQTNLFIKQKEPHIAAGLFHLIYKNAYLWHLQVLDLQVSGVHFFVSQTHFLEHAFTHALPLQQLLSFVLLPAKAASDSNIAVLAIKILRFIILKLKIYYSKNFAHT